MVLKLWAWETFPDNITFGTGLFLTTTPWERKKATGWECSRRALPLAAALAEDDFRR